MTSLTDININAFAEAVRAELADLTKREIQELTDGLEADLAEKFAEEGVNFAAASAADYAAELREAAGIAPKPAKRIYFSSAELLNKIEGLINRTEIGKLILDFGKSIQPVWWVARALIAQIIVSIWIPIPLWLLAIAVFLSVQWGRKKWFTNRFFSTILLPLNLIAMLLILPTFSYLDFKIQEFNANQEWINSAQLTDGLRFDGNEVTKIKAYQGETELFDLQFTDQNGNPLPSWLANNGNPIEIPDVSGMSVGEANTLLDDAGIGGADVIYEGGINDANGFVTRTEPAAGMWIDPNSAVKIFVGKAK
jgi:hypothetical protein